MPCSNATLAAAPSSASFPPMCAAVAILNVGLARTIAHPAVAASFDLLRSSFQRDGHTVRTFIYISTAGDDTAGQSHPAVGSKAWRKLIHHYYRPAALWVTEHNLPCNKDCASIPCEGPRREPPSFLQQFFKVRLAWGALLDWEVRHGWRFHWLLKLRPDLIWLESFPPLSHLAVQGDITAGDSVFVPRGVMTDNRNHYFLNDHVLLCPRGLCAPYFTNAIDRYQECSKDSRLRYVYPSQLWLFNHTCSRGELCYLKSKLLNLAYTIARQGGPECMRLYTAGYLWQFIPRCSALMPRWTHEDFANRQSWRRLLEARPEQDTMTIASLSGRLRAR